MNNLFDFPDLPIFSPSREEEVLEFQRPPPLNWSSSLDRNFAPSDVPSETRNVLPPARRWSCGDSQHAAAAEMPASYYHNLGFILHNHIRMSNHRYLSEFDCIPTAASPVSSANEPALLPPSYEQIGGQEQHSYSAYGNPMMQDNSFYENGPRSISAPSVGNSGLASAMHGNGNMQSYSGRRRFRTNFTEHQSMFLEDAFKESHYPDHKAKKNMADYLNIPEDRITVWFQNRRAKWRRKEHRHRDRSRNDTIQNSNNFDFPCFPSQQNEDMVQKVPMMYGMPTQQMSHEQFQTKQKECSEYQQSAHHQNH